MIGQTIRIILISEPRLITMRLCFGRVLELELGCRRPSCCCSDDSDLRGGESNRQRYNFPGPWKGRSDLV
jgi:hypothetical protein